MIAPGPDRPDFFAIRSADILLRVRAKPGAREDRVAGLRAGELVVSVRAVPERGKANEAITRLLAEALGLHQADVVLKAGGGSARKVFVLPLRAREGLERLARELGR